MKKSHKLKKSFKFYVGDNIYGILFKQRDSAIAICNILCLEQADAVPFSWDHTVKYGWIRLMPWSVFGSCQKNGHNRRKKTNFDILNSG